MTTERQPARHPAGPRRRARAAGRRCSKPKGSSCSTRSVSARPAHVFVRGSPEAAAARHLGARRRAASSSRSSRRRSSTRATSAAWRSSSTGARRSCRRRRHGSAARRPAVAGYTINEFIRYDPSLGSELLLGLRWTDDFGPVVTLGAGRHLHGVPRRELQAGARRRRSSRRGRTDARDRERPRTAGDHAARDRAAARPGARASRCAGSWTSSAVHGVRGRRCPPARHRRVRDQPARRRGGRLVGARRAREARRRARARRAPPRPIGKLRHLLEPRSVAIIGVSEKLNPGHIILNNLIREGFDRERIFVVKPGTPSSRGAGACPTSRRCPSRSTCSSSASRPPRRRRRSPTSSNAGRPRASSSSPAGSRRRPGTEAIVGRMHEALRRRARERLAGTGDQRRQLPGHPVAARPLRHDVHPRVQAAGARRAGVAGRRSSRRAARSPSRGSASSAGSTRSTRSRSATRWT